MADLQALVGKAQYSRSQIMAVLALSRAVSAENVHVVDIYGDTSLWMDVVFSWTTVGGATSYTLQIGTTSGASDYGTYDVGNVLTYTVKLPPGTYYARVVDHPAEGVSTEQGPFFV